MGEVGRKSAGSDQPVSLGLVCKLKPQEKEIDTFKNKNKVSITRLSWQGYHFCDRIACTEMLYSLKYVNIPVLKENTMHNFRRILPLCYF